MTRPESLMNNTRDYMELERRARAEAAAHTCRLIRRAFKALSRILTKPFIKSTSLVPGSDED